MYLYFVCACFFYSEDNGFVQRDIISWNVQPGNTFHSTGSVVSLCTTENKFSWNTSWFQSSYWSFLMSAYDCIYTLKVDNISFDFIQQNFPYPGNPENRFKLKSLLRLSVLLGPLLILAWIKVKRKIIFFKMPVPHFAVFFRYIFFSGKGDRIKIVDACFCFADSFGDGHNTILCIEGKQFCYWLSSSIFSSNQLFVRNICLLLNICLHHL